MDLERSTTPATCSALEPSSATAIASSHIRMRPRSPMFTQSETAPMVQKRVLFPTAPKMKARRNAPAVTKRASCAGSGSFNASGRRPDAASRSSRHCSRDSARPGLRGFFARRVGRLRAVGPRREELALRGDRAFVVALPGVSHADPVLRIGRERTAGIRHQEALHRRDRHGVVAELELVERRLVGLRLAWGGPFDLAGGRRRLVGARSSLLLARLLELPQARVDVDVYVFLPPVGGLDLIGEDLDLPAHAGDFGAQPVQLPGEIEQRAALAGCGLELGKAIFERLLARFDLLAQQLDATTRFVIVEEPLRKRRPGERAAERESSSLACPYPAHQYSPL